MVRLDSSCYACGPLISFAAACGEQESELGAFVDAEIRRTIHSVSSEALEAMSKVYRHLSRSNDGTRSKTASRRGARAALLKMFRPRLSAPTSPTQTRKDLLDSLENAMAYLSGVKQGQSFQGFNESDIGDALKGLEEILK